MTVDLLNGRIKELEQVLQQTLSNYNALEGAKQECLIWLKKIQDEQSSEQSLKGE